jgi:hypothetical protein
VDRQGEELRAPGPLVELGEARVCLGEDRQKIQLPSPGIGARLAGSAHAHWPQPHWAQPMQAEARMSGAPQSGQGAPGAMS